MSISTSLFSKENIDPEKLPVHIAVIMDGNGRWAKQRGLRRTSGHQSGVKAVKETVEAAAELGVSFLTLYAFSTENWNRPKWEINALMKLLVSTIHNETKTLMDNNIRLKTIGNVSALPSKCQQELKDSMMQTENNSRMTLILALNYSSRWEIINAVNGIVKNVKSGVLGNAEIDEGLFNSHLCTAQYPDPELLIRTSGEHRLSNFLLWQIAYAELYFSPKLWPDFRKEDFYEAILDFQKRERRFGKTSEQMTA